MTETIRYTLIGKEDLNLGTGTFEARLADGRVVTLSQVDMVDQGTAQTITAKKTMKSASFIYQDTNNQVLHAFGDTS